MRLIQAFFTEHPCYNAKRKAISPVGVFVHSTGAVNRELRRYVDCEEALGKNQYNNHWNKADAKKSVHAFIGYDKDRNVAVAETLPHDIACWGAGKGSKGSYNYNPHAYLQFEICQGSNTDEEYYWKAIGVAEEYCVHLCQMYGWTADNITSHAEAHKAGYASNHGDPVSWMRHFGDSMDKFRARVAARMKGGCGDPDAPPTEDESEDMNPVCYAIVACSGAYLNLRASKSTSAASLKRLNRGVTVTVLDDSDANWWRVQCEGMTGYAMTHSGSDTYLVRAAEPETPDEGKDEATLETGETVTVNRAELETVYAQIGKMLEV